MRSRYGVSAPPLLLVLLFAGSVAGCREEVTLRELVLEAAELELTKATDHAELRFEIAQVDAEQGLPLQIARPVPPGERNAATVLATMVDPKMRTGILERLNELFPEGEFQFTPLKLAEVRQFLGRHQQRLKPIYAALQRAECVFPIEFRLGFFYEPAFIDEATIACRLLAMEAAGILATGEVTAALRPVEAMWRLAGWLGQEPLLSARLRAAELRAEALLVVEAVANHPHARTADLKALFEIIEKQLAEWPPDAASLRGDRAMTLHTYECLRMGLLRWVLTSEERQRFRQEFSLDSLPQVIAETIDEDEWFYLAAMRRHIDACRLAYYKRKTELAQLAAEIDATRQSIDRSAYALLAATLFLPDIADAHKAMARDRARCEAFSLALAAALDHEPPAYEINPHHGRPYELMRESQRVVVRLHEPDERDVVIARPRE